MDKNYKKSLKRDTENYDELKDEEHFTGKSFTEELLPLLADYFVGEFKLDGNSIICSFANGQKFILKTEEI